MITLFDPEEIGKTEFIENTLYAAIDRYFDFHERVKSVIPGLRNLADPRKRAI